ncbi:MAG: potassium channel protein [Dehalococcoidales bacterium]|nr:potassium channel protein [Dehalococcoidales bacterium]
MKSLHKVVWGILALVAIIAIGTIGYETIEGWSFLDSIFMTITTITTVGYREVHPLSDGGRIFSIFLILGGMGGAFYTLTGIITYIIEGNIGATLGRRRMENKINQLKDHFILCGFGRVGEEIANIFKEEEVSFVVIDNRPECAARAEQEGYLYIQGDATSDETLKEAGIEKARGLVAALGSDIDNTYITLSARGLYPSLFITARASDSEAEKKLRRTGANRIVSPNSIGARRMAMLALRPTVMDFLDTISRRRGPELQMENVAIDTNSSLNGLTIEEIRRCSRATILALNSKNGILVPNPPSDEKVTAGDSLIIMGTSEQLNTLEAVCEGAVKLDDKI